MTNKEIENTIEEQVNQLISGNIQPVMLVCDPVHYNEFQRYFVTEVMRGLSPQKPLAIKEISVMGFRLRVVQRLESEFEGIHVLGTPKKK